MCPGARDSIAMGHLLGLTPRRTMLMHDDCHDGHDLMTIPLAKMSTWVTKMELSWSHPPFSHFKGSVNQKQLSVMQL